MSMVLGPVTLQLPDGRHMEVLVLADDGRVLRSHPKGPAVSTGLLHKQIEILGLGALV